MDANCIDYSETGSFSPAVIDYLRDDPKLRSFYSFRPDLDGFKQLIGQRKQPASRQLLVDVLADQYKDLPVSPLTQQHIQALLKDNAYTITTGHQLNIFTGPLYFIYKIVTAIKLARDLKQQFPDKDFVPVYWMASEDHDFAEINHTYIGQKEIRWEQEDQGGTGRLSTKTIQQALQAYIGILGMNENSEKLGSLLQTAYTKFKTLAAATRYLVNGLFSEYGLVILDADDIRLKKLFAPYIQQDIIGQHSFAHINQSSAALQQIGLHTQVNAREINFFYLRDNLRERIVFENGRYAVLNSDYTFTEAELSAEIEQFPDRFSPNVVMRPLYQEIILPNLAYIGGGAEVVYWLQLKANFDYYHVDFPILILRNSALVVQKKQAQKIRQIGLQAADLFLPSHTLKTNWVKMHSNHQLHLQTELMQLNLVFDTVKEQAQQIDVTLGPSAEAIRARINRAMGNLEKKMIKAEKRRHENSLNQIDRIKDELFPNGSLQERRENFGLYYAAWGESFIESLVEKFDPLDFKFTVLTER